MKPEFEASAASSVQESELRRILVDFNNTESPYPADRCVHELFEAQQEKNPEAIAVEFGDRSITYAELNRQANRLAHHLRSLGVKPEALVGLYVERSLDAIIAMVATLKAGGAYLPLDLSYPAHLLTFMLDDAKVTVLLTQEHLLDRLPALTSTVVVIDRTEFAQFSEDNPSNWSQSDDLAYVIYTSGSTGRPKGVAICHRAINRLVLNTDYIRLGDSDRIAQASNVSFDAATFEIWGALLNGARLIGVPKEILLSPEVLEAHLREHRIDVLFLTTALFNRLAHERPSIFQGLRDLLFGGEAVDPKWVARVLERGPPRRLLHVYGPTENTTFSTWYLVNEVKEGATTIPIGRPISNTQAYILDSRKRAVPIGEAGELHVGGDGLARGYLNRPELTAEKFMRNPFSDDPQSRLYQTGDWARFRPDGAIEFLGRIDHQIKLRGFRIEPGEIETLLEQHPAVRHALVLLRESQDNKQLVAYIVARETAAPGFVDLWQQLYENTYSEARTAIDATLNTVGWNSSYTGKPIAEEEMREWRDRTVDLILGLKPRRVLEIGCGTGMLLSRIAPLCESYVATDFSRSALDHIRDLQKIVDRLDRIELLERMADDFTGFEPQSFDTIVINSVLQHFPNADYLLRVMKGLVKLVCEGGHILIGDVSNLTLLDTFHTSVQLFKATDETSWNAWHQDIQTRVEQERDLWVASRFFTALAQSLPEITHVRVMPKQGHFHNQLTRFRFEALLHIRSSIEALRDIEWIAWHAGLDLDAIRGILVESRSKALGIRDIQNARLRDENLAMSSFEDARRTLNIGQLRAWLACQPHNGLEPDRIAQIAAQLGFHADFSCLNTTHEGRFDVVFSPSAWPFRPAVFQHESSLLPCETYVREPARIASDPQLVHALRVYLRQRLPDYMVPSAFVLLDEFPLTQNGKVDREALSRIALDKSPLRCTEFVAPRTAMENAVAEIWAEVLGVARVGLDDDFFALGGNSLNGMVLVNRLNQKLNLNLSLVDLFQAPTIGAILRASLKAAPVTSGLPDNAREVGEI